jgi:putative ABC transport system substrate-binding protein
VILKQAAVSIAFITLCAVADAQQPNKLPKIGFLIVPSKAFFADRVEAFRQGLNDLGYIEGKNILIDYRYADGNLDRLPELARELVGINVDIIVTTANQGAVAAQNATRSIPIVFTAVQDPVAGGIAASLARPGGNATGLSILAPELGGKRLEILKETVSKIRRAAFMWSLGPKGISDAVESTYSTAKDLGVQLTAVQVWDFKDFAKGFAAALAERVDGLLTNPSSILNTHRARIVEFALQNRLPAMYAAPEFVDAGGLMSYAPSYGDQFRRAATYVDKILKGAKPADLPVEQPKKFELVINLKAAKQIGLTIPPNVLARADRVIK